MVIQDTTQLSRALQEGVKKVRKKQVRKKQVKDRLKQLAKSLQGGQGKSKAKAKTLGESFIPDIAGALQSIGRKRKRKGPTFT